MAAISPQSIIVISQTRSSLSRPVRFSSPPNPRISCSSTNHHLSLIKIAVSSRSRSCSCSSVARVVPPVELDSGSDSSNPSSGWDEFASKVSGEWDGHGADFTIDGKPIEVPESVVPGAYREWDVQVFDWQTQCPTLAEPESNLPTVGCEADAATIYDVDERNVGGEGSGVSAFGYHSGGNYVVPWDVVTVEDAKLRLQHIKVFCEQWYGPFQNGEQLGGCAIRDSGFASTVALEASEVKGVWQSSEAVSRSHSSQMNIVGDLADGRTKKITRDENDLIMLLRQLWCSLKENENGNCYRV